MVLKSLKSLSKKLVLIFGWDQHLQREKHRLAKPHFLTGQIL
jgi:hypothetical protein